MGCAGIFRSTDGRYRDGAASFGDRLTGGRERWALLNERKYVMGALYILSGHLGAPENSFGGH